MAGSQKDIQAALDSVTTINQILNRKIVIGNGPDPFNPVEVMQPNIDHLANVKEKLPFTNEQLNNVNSAISNGQQFIIDNGGGGPTPSKTVGYFTDCVDGFIFAVDFAPKDAPINIGTVYVLNSLGYKGCGTLITTPIKAPAPYPNGGWQSAFNDCNSCLSFIKG